MHDLPAALDRVRALHAAGAYEEALALTGVLLERFPGCAALWVRRGKLMQLSDEEPVGDAPLDEIATCFQRAQVLAPGDAEADIELGHFRYAVEDDTLAGRALFVAAEEKALIWLREAIAGQLRCAVELHDHETIQRLRDRIAAMFPRDDELVYLCVELGIAAPGET